MSSGELVTLLFTDIEASTDRWEDDAERMSTAMDAHDATLDAAIERHGGRRFKHTGDGMCAIFPTPTSAMWAAVEAQHELRLPVRMGIHTGEVEPRDDDYFGPALNRCARIMEAGHGGQVLLSSTTAALLDGGDVRELGTYSLRGIRRPERIYQVGDGDFPPLRVRRSSNVPAILATLVGRIELIDDVVGATRSGRLVTLTGPGGVGKSSVALAAVHTMEPEFEASYFVGLQEVGDDNEVLAAVARALDLHAPTGDALVASLSNRRALLLLDNCEHVLDGAARIIEDALTRTDSCHVVTTSRERLGVDGEHVIPVPTLSASGPAEPAVTLFIDRARALHPEYEPDGDALDAIVSICQHLDGLPLAIELAAARSGVLSEAELLHHLDERFRLLTRPERGRGRVRQRTIEETIGWSYDLLGRDEQVDFARLAVFAGSFDLDAAAAVLGRDELDTLDRIEGLVDRSLLDVDTHASDRRYRFLETVGVFATDRLQEQGDSAGAFRAMHAYYAVALPLLVERFYDDMRTEAARLEREAPNLRRAFEWAVEDGHLAAATDLLRPMLRLGGRVVWPIHGWVDAALALPEASGSVEEPVLLLVQGLDRMFLGRFRDVGDIVSRALSLEQMPRPLPDDMLACTTSLLDVVNRYDESAVLVDERRRAGRYSAVDAFEEGFRRARAGHALDPAAAEAYRDLGQFGRANLAFLRTVTLARFGPSDELRAAAAEASDLFPDGCPLWYHTVQLELAVELSAENHMASLELADVVLEHAARTGDRSAAVIPLLAYAVCLQHLGEAETAAVVRARLPRRMTVMCEEELIALDDWLEIQLDGATRAELTARGSEIDPRALRDLAREVTERHLARGA